MTEKRGKSLSFRASPALLAARLLASCFLAACLLASCLFVSGAYAGSTPVAGTTAVTGQDVISQITDKTAGKTAGGGASVKARVEFRQAASYSVAHDPIDLTTATQAIDLDHVVTNEAHITIGSLKGETVLMTCGVSGVADHTAYTRDCDGTPSIKNHPVSAGHSIDDNILLTKDLLPTTSGVSDGSVSIQVTYP